MLPAPRAIASAQTQQRQGQETWDCLPGGGDGAGEAAGADATAGHWVGGADSPRVPSSGGVDHA